MSKTNLLFLSQTVQMSLKMNRSRLTTMKVLLTPLQLNCLTNITQNLRPNLTVPIFQAMMIPPYSEKET